MSIYEINCYLGKADRWNWDSLAVSAYELTFCLLCSKISFLFFPLYFSPVAISNFILSIFPWASCESQLEKKRFYTLPPTVQTHRINKTVVAHPRQTDFGQSSSYSVTSKRVSDICTESYYFSLLSCSLLSFHDFFSCP